MTRSDIQRTTHTITVFARPDAVFGLLADVALWPTVFPPTVHAERVDLTGDAERVRIWAMANGEPRGWTSRRELDRDGSRIRFRQESPRPPLAAMGGEWTLRPASPHATKVILTHDFRTVDDDPEQTAWLLRAVDHNSVAELAALKAAAEWGGERENLTLSFVDAVTVDGPASDVYDFLYDAARWPDRLPHVAAATVSEETPNIQKLDMDTVASDGSTHSTSSTRICFPSDRIVYKQVRTPPIMAAHTGQWRLRQEADTTTVSAAHTVVIAADAIGPTLGERATVGEARQLIREALSRNSTTTLWHAKEYAERRGRAPGGG